MGEEMLGQENWRPEALSPERHSGVFTLLFTDVVGSTALKQRLGDRSGVELLQEHHALVRRTLAQFPGAEEVMVAGDSFLVLFPVPSDAVKCAVLLQARLRQFNQGRSVPMQDRMGLHLGEVQIERTGQGSRNVYGIQVDTCARVMSLAKGGQILMTRPVFDNARQSFKGEQLEGGALLTWLNHGHFELKGVEESVEVCEVRPGDAGPLGAPSSSEKVRRVEGGARETVLGWRPALGQLVPNTMWRLEDKLGEGGFGEVWQARHEKLDEQRVFKFCFQADRVRSLKREVTLFRVLKERIGDHPNIVKLHDIYFEEPPFFLQEEYVAGRDLKHWCEAQGGVDKVPLETRLEIVAQAADALQAAHEAGVIHRDVKPGNILISPRSEAGSAKETQGETDFRPTPISTGAQSRWPGNVAGKPRPLAKLTDFGIGQVISDEILDDLTRTGFTKTILGAESSSHTGTQIYMAPELFEGKGASTRSDIYSLGVVLYQLLVGDFKRLLTTDWANDIPDPLLREDLHHCFAGKPGDRFAAAGLLAKNLRALPQRRTELQRQEAEKATLERVAYRRGVVRMAAIASVVLAVMLILGWQWRANALVKIRQAAQIRSTAVRLTVANGLSPAESGDWLSAALWFSEAFVLDESFGVAPDPELTRQSHLLRINSVLRQSPSLEQMWFETENLAGGFTRDGTHVLLGDTNGFRLYSVASGEPASAAIGAGHTLASLAPDGQRAVTGGGSPRAMLTLWNVVSGECLSYLRSAEGNEPFHGGCGDLQFSMDGRWIAAAVSGPGSAKVDRVVIWDAETARMRRVIRYADAPNVGWAEGNFILAARFDASGQRLLTTGSDRRAVVWHWQTEQPPQVLQGHRSWVYSGSFGRVHTNWVVTCSFDRTACVWDLRTGQFITRVEHEGDGINDVQFGPDDHAFVTAGLDSTVRLWDSETGRKIPPILRSHERVLQVQWSSDGARLLAHNRDGTTRVWRLKSEKPVVEPTRSDFSEDGRQMLTLVSGTLRTQNSLSPGDAGIPEPAPTNVVAYGFAGEPNRLVSFSEPSSSRPGQVEVRRLGDRAVPAAALVSDPSWSHLVSAPAGNRFAFYGLTNETLPDWGGQAVLVWEPESSSEPGKLVFTNEFVEALSFDHAGQRLAIATVVSNSTAGILRLVDLEAKGKPPIVLLRCQQRFAHLAFSRDSRWLIAARWDGELNPGDAIVWQAAKGDPPFVQDKRLPHLDGVLHAAFSDSGQAIATASEDQTAIVWQRVNGDWEPSLRPLRCGGQVYLCAFSRNRRWLATAHRTPESQQTGYWKTHVRVWDIANNEAISLPFEVPGKLTRLAFVADDTRIFAEQWRLPTPPQRWLIDLAKDEGSAKRLLLRAQFLSSQRSFLSGRVQHLPQALEGRLSAEEALVHARSIGPLRPLSKQDCRDLRVYLSPQARPGAAHSAHQD